MWVSLSAGFPLLQLRIWGNWVDSSRHMGYPLPIHLWGM